MAVRQARLLALLIAFASGSAVTAPPPQVVDKLKKIPSIVGGSVFERMRACRITVESESFFDGSGLGSTFAKPGEGQLMVFIDVPPVSESPHDRELFHGMNAIWSMPRDGGAPRPETGWAKDLQLKPAPLGSPAWLNC